MIKKHLYFFPLLQSTNHFTNCFQSSDTFLIFISQVFAENSDVKTVWGWIMKNYQDPIWLVHSWIVAICLAWLGVNARFISPKLRLNFITNLLQCKYDFNLQARMIFEPRYGRYSVQKCTMNYCHVFLINF